MYRRILVPIDGSNTSMRAVTEAAKLAHVCGARIDLLHVVEALSGGFEPTQIYLEEILPRFLQRGEKLLKETANTLRAAGVPTETILLEGGTQHVSQFIVDQACSRGADLIVLGTHGRRGFSRMMMGSDAEQVARTSPVPVMLVRPQPPVQQAQPATQSAGLSTAPRADTQLQHA